MTTDAIDGYRTVLKAATTQVYALHRDGMATREWLAAGVWGAVFLEAFLEEAMLARGIPATERELGGMTQQVRHESAIRWRR